MGFYDKYLLPRIIDCSCGMRLVRGARARLAPLASGDVLEIGIGSGLNLPLYDAARVRRVFGIDPSGPMIDYSRKRSAGLIFPVELRLASAEQVALPSDSIDTVVVTFALCSIPDVEAALREMRRVLKPDGKLLFLEHGLAPDSRVRRWQRRLTPLWKTLAGGCHLDRDIPALIVAAGFRIDNLDKKYLPRVPRFAGYGYRGIASPV